MELGSFKKVESSPLKNCSAIFCLWKFTVSFLRNYMTYFSFSRSIFIPMFVSIFVDNNKKEVFHDHLIILYCKHKADEKHILTI